MQSIRTTPEIALATQLQFFMETLAIKFASGTGPEKASLQIALNDCYNNHVLLAENTVETKSESKKKSKKKSEKSVTEIPLTPSEAAKLSYNEIVSRYLPPHLDIKLKGNNNVNIIVTDLHDTSVVLQYACKRDLVSDEILEGNCIESTKNYLPKIPIKINQKSMSKPFNPTNDEFLVASCIELCPTSIEEEVKGLDDIHRIALAINIGRSVSDFLERLSDNGMIMTDLKRENILLRADKSVAFPDTKSITRVDQINFSLINGTKLKCNLEVTEIFNSNAIKDKRFIKVEENKDLVEFASETRQLLKQEWEKEYSYQIAVLLYYILTGVDKETDGAFKFDEFAIFASKAGQRMREIIIQLSHDISEKRLKYSELPNQFKSNDFTEVNKILVENAKMNADRRIQAFSTLSSPQKPKLEKPVPKRRNTQSLIRRTSSFFSDSSISSSPRSDESPKIKSIVSPRAKIDLEPKKLEKSVSYNDFDHILFPTNTEFEKKEKRSLMTNSSPDLFSIPSGSESNSRPISPRITFRETELQKSLSQKTLPSDRIRTKKTKSSDESFPSFDLSRSSSRNKRSFTSSSPDLVSIPSESESDSRPTSPSSSPREDKLKSPKNKTLRNSQSRRNSQSKTKTRENNDKLSRKSSSDKIRFFAEPSPATKDVAFESQNLKK